MHLRVYFGGYRGNLALLQQNGWTVRIQHFAAEIGLDYELVCSYLEAKKC